MSSVCKSSFQRPSLAQSQDLLLVGKERPAQDLDLGFHMSGSHQGFYPRGKKKHFSHSIESTYNFRAGGDHLILHPHFTEEKTEA